MESITWRPYQIACKRVIKNEFEAGITEQLIVMATGTGKRLMSINLIQHFNRTLFIAHREELIMQAYDEIVRFYPMQCGIIKGPVFEIEKKIVVASIQTLYNRLDRIKPEYFDLVIYDECHHGAAVTYLKTIRHFKPKLLTGWTATPKRLDNLSLSNIFQKIVFDYPIEQGIKDGWLCELEAYQIRTRASLEKVHRVAGDFNQRELSEVVDCPERNALIVDKYNQYCNGEQAIAFCVDIDHAYHLRDAFVEKGVIAEAIVSDQNRCPNRAEIVEQFKKGNIQVLVNVEILTEGFDYEDIGAILMARPTQSESLYIQGIGRGTRLKSEKFKQRYGHEKCIILDFVDNTGKHSLVNSYELEKDKPIEERLFIPQSHREKLIEERERRIRMMQANRTKDKAVDLLVLPKVTVWQSKKMLEPATAKQIKWIRDLGYWQEGIEYTKAMASEIIGSLPARKYQLEWLARQGYDVTEGATQGQFSRVKFLHERKNRYQMFSNESEERSS